MASSLRRQLATLRKEQGHVQPHHHKTDSLLFTEEEAKNIDYETALNLGTNGLMELCKHDNTLSVFLETLLSPASAEQDRMMLDKTENKKLDTQIDLLLVKLSRFALMKATVKVLEYLVRRYLIHIFNLDSLILFALPFHQTQLFVKILKISKVKGTPWGFFRGVKRAKSPATRGFIVERCIQEPSLLSLLLEKCGVFLSHASSTNHLAKESFADPRHFLSFCCGVVVEVMGGVGGSHRVDEGLLHRILPFVTEGLKSKIQDYQASSYMILSQLSSLVQFSQEVPPLLLSRIAKSKPPAALLSSAIITFATVCNTQFSSLSATLIAPETVVQLLKHPRFLIQVEEVVQQYELSKFVGLFLRSLLALVVKGKANNKSIQKVLPFLGIVANEGLLEPVVASCVRLLVKTLYENEGEDDVDMEVDDEDESDEEDSGVFKKRDFVLRVLRFLNVRFPEEVDKGFNAELKALKEEDKSGDEDEEEEDEEYDKKQAALYHKWLMDLVGAMEPLLGEKGGMVVEEVGETVGVALVHPSATVRLLALERVMNVVEGVKNKGGEEDDDEDDEDEENKKGWKVGLARVLVVVAGLLEDGEEEVVQKALAVLSLASSFPLGLELLRGEEKVGEVVWRMLRKGDQKGTVSLSSLALRLRSETGLEEGERNWGFVELLFDCLFARKGGLKATELALICLRDSPRLSAHPLFKELNARALLKSLSPLMKGKEDAEKVVKFSRSILDAVAKGLTASKTEGDFGACLEVLGHLAGLGEDGKAGFFHSRLFGFFALNIGCEMLHIKGEDCLANPSAGRSLRCSLVLLSHCSSLFGASSLGGSSTKSTSKAGLAGVLKAVSWGEEVQEGKKGKKNQKKTSSQDLASYVLLFSLDTIIQYLPKDSSSLVLPCHLLFDLQTSLELLCKENKKNSGAMVEQRRVILLSTLSTLYLFLLSPSAPTSSSPLSIFHPQFKSLITHHLSNKFLSFSSTFYTAPTRPVFLTQSSDVKSVSPSDGDWGLFTLREGTWIGHPGVQSRALTQVNLFLAVNGNSLEKGAKGKQQECGAFYDRILEVIPGILVALRSELALVRKGALDCLLTICHHLFWLEKAIGSSASLSPAILRESLEILAKNNDNISTTTTITTSLPNKQTLPDKFHLYLISAIQSCLVGAEEEKKGKKGANKRAVEKRGDLVYSALALVQILLRSHQSPDVISSLLPTIHLLVGWLDASPSASSPTSYFYLYSQIWKEFVCFTIPFLCQEGGKRGTTVKSPAIQNCFDFFMSILNNPHSSSFRFEEATNFTENIDGITESDANVTPITDFSLSGVLCSALTPEVFGCFSAKNKREVVFALAKLGHFREAHPASRAAKEGLERLEVSAEIFAEAVKDCVGLLAGKGSVSASVDSVVPKKRRKGEEGGVASSASVFAGSAAASGLGEEEQRLERVGDVLQVLVGRELGKVGGGVPVLLYSLLDLLSTLMKMAKEGGEQGKGKKGRKEKKGELSFRFVFVMHLCLGCIRSMFMFLRTGSEQRDALSFSSEQQALPLPSALSEEKKGKKKSKGALPTAWKEVSGKLFTVEQLVDFFTSSVDVQTNNLALLLIAEIARCYPHTVIPCVLSIFTYMGEETLSREDNYTFMVVQHAIDAIVPAVMAASEKKGCGGVSSAVELFVGAVERIPGHRRLLLFGMLIKVVGAGALHHIILQLLLKGVMVAVERGRGEGEGREGGFEYGKFVIDLCLQFSPLNIARAMTMVLDILLSVSYEGDKKGGKKEEKERELLVMGVKKGLGYSSPKDREFLVDKIKESFGEGEKGIVGRRGLRAMAVEMGSAYFTNEGVLSKLISLEKREDIVLHNELLNLFQFCLLQMRQYPLDESQSGFIDDLSELQASQTEDSDEDSDEDEDSSDEEDDDEDVSMSDEEDGSKEEIKRGKKYMSFSDTASFVKAIRNATLDFIEILNELMSISAFIKAVTNLLRHQDSAIRRSALQMLNEKIVKAVEHDMLSPSHADLFLSMVPILVQQIQNGLGEKKSTKGGRGRKRRGMDVDEEQDLDEKKSQDDSEVNIQTALLTLEILARHFGSSHPEKFSPSAAISVECVSHPSLPVVSSAVISFATHCAEMGALALPQLPRMVPLLLELLKNNMKGQAKEKSSKVLLSEEQVMVLMSVLSAMEVLFITIGQFLSPYLVDIIGFLIDPVFCTGGSGVRRMLNEKSDAVLIAFSKHTQTRHVFACVFGVYDPEAAYHPSSLARLVGIVGRVVESLPTQDVVQNHKKLLKFFIEVFDYRRAVVARGQGVDGSQVEWVERECVGAFVKMVVKLNEVCFKPLFLKLLDWACTPPNLTTRMVEEATAHMAHISDPYRARTFLGVVVELASTLKSIFSPFYVYVVDHLLSYLLHEDYRNGLLRTRRKGDENRRSKRLNKKEDPLYHQITLFVLKSFHKLFLFDSGDVVDVAMFNKVVGPLADMLGSYKHRGEEGYKEMVGGVVQCLVQLAVVVNSDLLWKTLNHNVLNHTRSSSARVRSGAVQVEIGLYDRLGEEFLLLLPESVSYFSELMEDGDHSVEVVTRRLMKKIDSLLGDESIQDYF